MANPVIHQLIKTFPSKILGHLHPCQLHRSACHRLQTTPGVATTCVKNPSWNTRLKQKKPVRTILPQVSTKLRESVFLNDRYKNTISDNIKSSTKLEKFDWDKPLERNHLQKLSMQEIMDMLVTMVAVRKSSFLSCMENVHLRKRLRAWHNMEKEFISRISESSIETNLIIADLFFCCHHEYQSSNYFLSLIDFYLKNQKGSSLAPTSVVQLLFYASTTRKCRAEHMIFVENVLVENNHELTGKEMALLCFSFFVNNVKITKKELLVQMSDTVLHDFEAGTLDIGQLINVLKAFRHAAFDSLPFFQKIGNLFCDRHRLNRFDLNPTQIATIFHTYSSLRILHPKLFEVCLQEFEERWKKRPGVVRAKDLARVVGSCVSLNVDVPQWLTQDLVHALSDSDQQRKFPTLFLEALHYFATCGVYPHNLFDIALSDSMVKRMTTRSEIHFNRLLLLDTCLGIECHNYYGKRLNKEFLSLLPRRAKGDIEQQFVFRAGLGSLYLTLQKICGKDNVSCHFLLPFSKTLDIELRLDADGNPTPVDSVQKYDTFTSQYLRELTTNNTAESSGSQPQYSVLQGLLKEEDQNEKSTNKREIHVPDVTHRKSKKISAERRLSIRVMSWNQYLRNVPGLTGQHEMEIRLLNKLGFDVILISPDKAAQLRWMSTTDLLDFIKHLIA